MELDPIQIYLNRDRYTQCPANRIYQYAPSNTNIVGWEPFGSLRNVTQIVKTSLLSLISAVPALKAKLQTSTSKLIYTTKIYIIHK